MGVTLGPERGVAGFADGVMLGGDAGPVIEGFAQSVGAGLAPLDPDGLAASLGHGRGPAQGSQGRKGKKGDRRTSPRNPGIPQGPEQELEKPFNRTVRFRHRRVGRRPGRPQDGTARLCFWAGAGLTNAARIHSLLQINKLHLTPSRVWGTPIRVRWLGCRTRARKRPLGVGGVVSCACFAARRLRGCLENRATGIPW